MDWTEDLFTKPTPFLLLSHFFDFHYYCLSLINLVYNIYKYYPLCFPPKYFNSLSPHQFSLWLSDIHCFWDIHFIRKSTKEHDVSTILYSFSSLYTILDILSLQFSLPHLFHSTSQHFFNWKFYTVRLKILHSAP